MPAKIITNCWNKKWANFNAILNYPAKSNPYYILPQMGVVVSEVVVLGEDLNSLFIHIGKRDCTAEIRSFLSVVCTFSIGLIE